MRRILYWYVPLAAALAGVAIFLYGFSAFLRHDTGESVDVRGAMRELSASAPPAPRDTIVPIILGDSLARGTGDESGLGIGGRLDAELQRRHVAAKKTVNVAVNGAHTAELLQQLESRNVRTLLAQSNTIIISIGGNDLWGGGDWRNAPPPNPEAFMNDVLDRVTKIVGIVREANPKARIFLIGLYNPFISTPFGKALNPFVNRWNAKELERFAADPRLTVVQTSDLFAFHDRLSFDRFHPGDEGYQLIATRIAESL